MSYGRNLEKAPNLSYCKFCKRFYVGPCNCSHQIAAAAPHLLDPNFPALIKRFLFFVFTVYEYTRTLVKPVSTFHKEHRQQAFSMLAFKKLKPEKPRKSLLSKYIYLCNNSKSFFKPIKHSYYVYMVTTQMDNGDKLQPEESSLEATPRDQQQETSDESTPRNETAGNSSNSSSSVISKKSGTGKVLSKISKTLKMKKKFEDLSEETERDRGESSERTSCCNGKCQPKSKIPVLKLKVKSAGKAMKTASQSPKPATKTQSFFKKLVTKNAHSKQELEKKAEEAMPQKAPEVIFVSKSDGKSQSYTAFENKKGGDLTTTAPFHCNSYHVFTHQNQSPFCRQHTSLTMTFNEGLREAVELYRKLQESESDLVHTISKYILDHSFQKKLLDVLVNHAKLHMEAEKRAQIIAQEMWLQQSELMRVQEEGLQEQLNTVARQNKQLQDEIDVLLKKNEKLYVAQAKQCPKSRSAPFDSNYAMVENMSKYNDRLRYKNSALVTQIESWEKDYQGLQKKIQLLEHQLQNSAFQVRHYKSAFQKAQTEKELEYARLSRELQLKQLTIKESGEAGDVLLEDLDALKRQLKPMMCALNWTKFKSRGSSLPDLIMMCRSCINELAKELQTQQTTIILKDRDNNCLKEEIQRLEASLETSKGEQERMQNQLKMHEASDIELKNYMLKCNGLEHNLEDAKREVEVMSSECEREKVSLMASVEDMEKLNKQIIEKNEELIMSKEKMCEYKSENDALRMQIHGLKQILQASGSGDIARELGDVQEKMTFFQSQYYQLMSEKNYLVEQLQAANAERGTLNQFQNTYYQFIQSQQQDLEVVSKDNVALKQLLEEERSQVMSLKCERNQLMEEKNVMKQIYHQLKNEISRVQQLQGEVVGMNTEASRLAIIAEYNRLLGEKLQCEVVKKDEKISELQSNVEKLNSAQLESAKDKVALCVELSEVCSINDQLNSTLAAEHQKSAQLNEVKKKIENSAKAKLKSIGDMQRAERMALKELLKDFKGVVKQRDSLLSSQSEHLQQIEELRSELVTYAKNAEEATERCMQIAESHNNLENQLKENNARLNNTHEQIEKQAHTIQSLDGELQQLKHTNDLLTSSKAYLQSTVQKLHHDLNESRKNEIEAQDSLKKEMKNAETLQLFADQKSADLAEAVNENCALRQQIAELTDNYEKFEEDVSKTQTTLEKELEETRSVISESDEAMRVLKENIAEKDLELIGLQDYCKTLEEELKQMESSVEDIEDQSRLLSESNAMLNQVQNALRSLEKEHEKSIKTIKGLYEEKLKLQGALKAQLDAMESKYSFQTTYIEDIIKEHVDYKKEAEADLRSLLQDLQATKKELARERENYDKIIEKYKDSEARLLCSIRILAEERVGKQQVEENTAKLAQQLAEIKEEKAAIENKLRSTSAEVEELKSQMHHSDADKKTLQNNLSELQELYKRSQSQETIKSNVSVRSSKISTIKEPKNKPKSSQKKSKKLAEELAVLELKNALCALKHQLTVMEFQKCEVALRLHETEVKLKTEQSVNVQLTEINRKIVGEVLTMERNGVIARPVSELLLRVIQEPQPEPPNLQFKN